MKPLTSVREYHYWSERLIAKLWQDNVSHLPNTVNVSAGISNFTIQAQSQDAPDTKAARAAAIEDLLADQIVTDFDYDGPLTYLGGRSQIVLSSLQRPQGDETGAVTLFADLQSQDGKRVAVCLFGSARNVCDWQPPLSSWQCRGWVSSTIKGVELLLLAGANAENSDDPKGFWREAAKREGASTREICWNAQNICANQGMESEYHDLPWRRGYTIGHYNDAEWLAQIYFEHSDPANPYDSFDTVYVGAALWVRSASPRAWVPYTPKNIPAIEAAQHPVIQRPFARVWYRFRGQHMHHARMAKKHPAH